jgi:hypothetical protein
VRLKETNWDAPGGASDIEVDYPDAPITDLVNWLRRTSAWLENPELVERRVRRLNGQLMDYRNAVGNGVVDAAPAIQAAIDAASRGLLGRMADPAFRAEVERALKEYRAIHAKANRLAALERARDAKRAKRDAVSL